MAPQRVSLWRWFSRLAVINAVGALLVKAYQDINPSNRPYNHAEWMRESGASTVVLLVFSVVVAVVGAVWARRQDRLVTGWAQEGRAPTDEERRRVLHAPWLTARANFVIWVVGAVIFGALNLVFDPSWFQTVRVSSGILLGGLSTSAVAYLSIEHAIRALLPAVLADGPAPGGRGPGIRSRLMVFWAVGSAIPLLLIFSEPFGLHPNLQRYHFLLIAMMVLSVVGLVAGFTTIRFAATRIAEPLSALRAAQRSVEAGDLDVSVPVDDAGEVGLLQAGFNRMVTGLRERRTLEDLFGRHVGTDVARHALEAGVELGGERREVSVLFVDVIGSTALAQRIPPEDVVAALNAFFDAVVRAVDAERGWVNKFHGDGALCIFGAPHEEPEHAARALRAARTLRRELLTLSATVPGLDAGIGVSSGSVVAGNVGTEQRFEYTVIGDPVNEASRLSDEAKTRMGRVLASDETIARAGDEARRWTVADELELRGRAVATLAYEPTRG